MKGDKGERREQNNYGASVGLPGSTEARMNGLHTGHRRELDIPCDNVTPGQRDLLSHLSDKPR